jgi:hypothetical protein
MSRVSISASRPGRRGSYCPQFETLESRDSPGSLLGPGVIDPGSSTEARERQAAELAILASLPASGHAPSRTTSPVTEFDEPHLIVFGESTLRRTDEDVGIHLKTSGLVPGGAYTVWWVVIEDGTTFADRKVGRATGFVAGSNGKANLTLNMNEGETLVDHPTRSGGSLEDARRAEIRVSLRFHGPADPDPARLFEQTHSFEEGIATDAQVTIHVPPS